MSLALGCSDIAELLPRVSTDCQVVSVAYLVGAILLVLNRLGFLQRVKLATVVRGWVFGDEAQAVRTVRSTRYYELFNAAEARVGEAVAETTTAVPHAASSALVPETVSARAAAEP